MIKDESSCDGYSADSSDSEEEDELLVILSRLSLNQKPKDFAHNNDDTNLLDQLLESKNPNRKLFAVVNHHEKKFDQMLKPD